MSVPHDALTLTHPLCLGSNGNEVRVLQTLLNQAGLEAMLTTDGRFGKKTQVALQALQRQKSLKPDGVVGPGTAKALGWNYQAAAARPYTIRYDAPPLPPMTPPLAVALEAIRVGMDTFKDLMFDGITKVYARTNYGVPTSADRHSNQFRQVKARLADLDWHFNKIGESFKQLQDQAANGGEPNVAGLRHAFAYFVSDMVSSLREMELLSGSTNACKRALEQLPHQHVLGILERVLRGEQTAVMAMSHIQIAFDNANRNFAASLRS